MSAYYWILPYIEEAVRWIIRALPPGLMWHW